MRIVTLSFAAAGELGDVLHDAVVEAELPLVEQDHDAVVVPTTFVSEARS